MPHEPKGVYGSGVGLLLEDPLVIPPSTTSNVYLSQTRRLLSRKRTGLLFQGSQPAGAWQKRRGRNERAWQALAAWGISGVSRSAALCRAYSKESSSYLGNDSTTGAAPLPPRMAIATQCLRSLHQCEHGTFLITTTYFIVPNSQ